MTDMHIRHYVSRAFFEAYSPSLFLLLLCIIVPQSALVAHDSASAGFTAENILSALTFHFTHANIFHLLANFYVIARFRPRWINVPVAYLSATAAALMPFSATSAPTVGISAVVFAMLARRDAILHIWNWRLLGLNLLLAFIPCYNWKIHLLAYLIALFIWKTYILLNDRLRSRNGKRR